jgi:hypothetical protein
VYTVVRAPAGSDAEIDSVSLQFKHVATQLLQPPVAALSNDGHAAAVRISSITLHKMLCAVSLLWSTGHLQVLQFSHSAHWYTSTPRQSSLRHLGRFFPSPYHVSDSSESMSGDVFQGASFALEPSCLVLAGIADSPAFDGSGAGGVGLSVRVALPFS